MRGRVPGSALALALLVLPTHPGSVPEAAAQERALPRAAADSAEALAAFRANIAAIHGRDRAAYLSLYLRSDRLVRVGPGGQERGWEGFAAGAGETFPDTLVASHFRVTPVADGVAFGSYRYRVVQDGVSARGVSERVLVRGEDGWEIAVTTAFPADPALPPPAFALVGATLVDGTGAPPVPDAVVVMEEGRIRCAGPRERCPVPAHADEVDARGHWIIPGLVDAHVHFSQTGWADGRPDALDVRDRHPYEETVARLRAHPELFFQSYLCSGVTSVYDVGGFPWTWELEARARGTARAPRVAAAGPLLSTRDHWVNVPAERQFLHLADEDAVRAGASYLAASGTHAMKVWYLGSPDPEEAARQRAHLLLAGELAAREGIPLIVHATSLEGAKDALRAGAALLVHSVENAEVDDEFLALARNAGTVYTPTLTVYEGYGELRSRRFDEDRTDPACVDPGTLSRARSTRTLSGGLSPEDEARAAELGRARAERMARNVVRVHRAGIPVAMGTDAGNPLTLHGPAVFREMEALQEAGLTPMEVLVASTRNGALAMGLGDELGTVEAGKAADLVVLRADPARDVRNVRSVALVVKGGEIFTRRELEFSPRP